MERFILQPSEREGFLVCTDQVNLLVCTFQTHKFNDTQEITQLENFNPANFMNMARYLREMTDWLREQHYDKVF